MQLVSSTATNHHDKCGSHNVCCISVQVPNRYIAPCPVCPDPSSRAGGEAEVEPWGISDAEGWTKRRQAGQSVLGNETLGCQVLPEQVAQSLAPLLLATLNIPVPVQAMADCSEGNQTMRVVSELLPGVGVLPAASDSLAV